MFHINIQLLLNRYMYAHTQFLNLPYSIYIYCCIRGEFLDALTCARERGRVRARRAAPRRVGKRRAGDSFLDRHDARAPSFSRVPRVVRVGVFLLAFSPPNHSTFLPLLSVSLSVRMTYVRSTRHK